MQTILKIATFLLIPMFFVKSLIEFDDVTVKVGGGKSWILGDVLSPTIQPKRFFGTALQMQPCPQDVLVMIQLQSAQSRLELCVCTPVPGKRCQRAISIPF
jgi:hypothetical protein